MRAVSIEPVTTIPIERQKLEVVERKGLGHPDTICDLVAEDMAQRLCRFYLDEIGEVPHFNVENGFLVAGQSQNAFGGGSVNAPMRFVFGDSITSQIGGRTLPVHDVVQSAAKEWFRNHLPLVDTDRHLILQDELHSGSAQLSDLFARGPLGANDTCIGSGYAPLTRTEKIVLEAENFLNSSDFKKRYRETGQDVKVTAVRQDRKLILVISLAFVDLHILSEAHYFEIKRSVASELEMHLAPILGDLRPIEIEINTADITGRGEAGVYLTVLGTSADSGDGGQIGRGNRQSGVNSFNRLLASGAVAGKNPVSNVGKIYALLASRIAETVVGRVPELAEAYVCIASRIGAPLDQPLAASLRCVPHDGTVSADIEAQCRSIIEEEIGQAYQFAANLANFGVAVS